MPRPRLTTERATAPNEMLHMDFTQVKLSPGDHDALQHVLVIIDNFSRFVQLYPTRSADGDAVVTALADWITHYGLPKMWTSDRGSHFNNDIIESLAARYNIRRHFTVAYAPWSNGLVERVGRELRETLSALMLSRLARDDDWTLYIPLVCFTINNSASTAIAGHTPFEVFTGHPPSSAWSTVFRPEFPHLYDVSTTSAMKHIKRLRDTLDSVHQHVNTAPKRVNCNTSGHPIDFAVGDFVVVSRKVADKTRAKDKTKPIWFGPVQVVRQVNPRVFEVEDITTHHRSEVHADYLRRFTSSAAAITPSVRAIAAHGSRGFVPVRVLSHVLDVGNEVFLQVQWETDDITWEPFRRFALDAPRMFNAYVRALSSEDRAVFQ